MATINDVVGCTDFEVVNKNNFQQIKSRAIKIGYSDGVNEGRENNFQKGFDKGYRDGLIAGFDIEKFRCFFNHLNTGKINNKALVMEKEKFNTIPIANVKSIQLEGNGMSPVSQKYVVETTKLFDQEMPVTMNLLSVQTTNTDFM